MLPRDAWIKLNDHIKFFNFSNFSSVPSQPGIYAWFVPLTLKSDQTPFELVKIINDYLLYDTKLKNSNELSARLEYTWDDLVISGKKEKTYQASYTLEQCFEALQNDKKVFNIFEVALVASTIFTPPIYVGLTGNLKNRCFEHIEGRGGKDKNNFYNRLKEFNEARTDKKFEIKDLYFACCPIQSLDTEINSEGNNNQEIIIKIIEEVLKHIIKPSFGER